MTRREWVGAIVIALLVIAAEAYVLPRAAHWPPLIPPEIWERFRPPTMGKVHDARYQMPTVVFVGAMIVVAGLMLYCWWVFRPLAIQFTKPLPIPLVEPPPADGTPERE
jgi:hypothetical protein